MRTRSLLIFTLAVFVASGCSSPSDQLRETANANSAPTQASTNPNWPDPDWVSDTAAVVNGPKQLPFAPPGLKPTSLSVPSDWTELGKRPTSILLKSPTIDEKFANLTLYSSDTKPVLGAIPRPHRDFDYSGFEPDAALKHFQELRGGDPSAGRFQPLTVGGLNGLLEQAIVKDPPSANSAPKDPNAVWQWTTFVKAKSGIQQIVLAIVYPAADKETFKNHINAIANSLKFEPLPETKVVETQAGP